MIMIRVSIFFSFDGEGGERPRDAEGSQGRDLEKQASQWSMQEGRGTLERRPLGDVG